MLIAKNITKEFTRSSTKIKAINDISLEIASGNFLLIKGKSGSGKSTLLFSLGGMLSPTVGEVLFQGVSLYRQNSKTQNEYRSKKIGFVFQGAYLLPYLNVSENIALGLKISGQKIDKTFIKKTAIAMGLEHRLQHKPSELSAGEQQRVALARAIIKKPTVIFADEPTGNLDKENSLMMLDYLAQYQKKEEGTVAMVTHRDLADTYATHILTIENGRLQKT